MPRLNTTDSRDDQSGAVCQNCGGTGQVLDVTVQPPRLVRCPVCGGARRVNVAPQPMRASENESVRAARASEQLQQMSSRVRAAQRRNTVAELGTYNNDVRLHVQEHYGRNADLLADVDALEADIAALRSSARNPQTTREHVARAREQVAALQAQADTMNVSPRVRERLTELLGAVLTALANLLGLTDDR